MSMQTDSRELFQTRKLDNSGFAKGRKNLLPAERLSARQDRLLRGVKVCTITHITHRFSAPESNRNSNFLVTLFFFLSVQTAVRELHSVMKMSVLRDVASCIVVKVYRRFVCVCCLHRQGNRFYDVKQHYVVKCHTALRNFLEDTRLRNHRSESLKSAILFRLSAETLRSQNNYGTKIFLKNRQRNH